MKKYKFIEILLVALMSLMLFGCGSDGIKGEWKNELGMTYYFDGKNAGHYKAVFGDETPFTYSYKDGVLEVIESIGGFEQVSQYLIKIENNQLKMAPKTNDSTLVYTIFDKVNKTKNKDDGTPNMSSSDLNN